MGGETTEKYDYIIAGSGCAGLSLLYRMLQDPELKFRRILIIDKEEKRTNDRTWCYWEKGKGLFEPIVAHEWKTLQFISNDFTRQFNLNQYSYKMIRGIDFYHFVLGFSKDFDNVSFKYEPIQDIQAENNHAYVITDKAKYQAEYVFNSTSLFHPEINPANSLLQHFEGWVIKTEQPVFNSEVGTLMDFRLDQKNGATFMYILPLSSTEALVEYTLFSRHILEKTAYKTALEDYIQDFLKIEKYEIIHKEFGVIPMSLAKFPGKSDSGKRLVHIGTAGGFTKASSGYTFQFIQKNTRQIVKRLHNNESPNIELTFRDKMFHWYDRTLLEVLISGSLEGKEIFSRMFKTLPPEMILAFLGNESSLKEEIQIMKSLPIKPFLIGGLKQLK